MPWPNDHCPPSGPTANEHLDYILNKAQTELMPGPLLQRIIDAINACKGGHCLISGNPPAAPLHCQKVLWARALACQSNWGLCANELEHGQ